MVKQKIENLAEKIANKGHASAPLLNKKKPSQVSKAANSENNLIQLRAYQIHQEKGGSQLDNWLEAERILGRPDSL